ncbi:hypothetical protein [Rosenbergiella epipactidis]|uniref:hypothetical protein n=1 Tax=Rosenbergiella epipactidis TaxID=1544694 RepID=UPI001F4E64D0|nr:hypothetical protein [Rosenbergiella epipactidis]
MYQVLTLNGKTGIAFSLDGDEILSNKELIFKVADNYMVDINVSDICRAKEFTERFYVRELVFILDQEGLSFLPRHFFFK